MSQYISRKVSAISLFAILCVILQHCLVFGGRQNVEIWGINLNLNGLFWYGILDWPVSFFFVVSGFNIMKHRAEKYWYVPAIGKRLRSLLIPYVMFCFAGIIITDRLEWGGVMSNFGMTSLLPIVPPMWYVRTLFVLCLLSPVILWIMRLSFRISLVSLLLLFFILVPIDVPGKRALFLSLFYFAVGVFIAVHGARISALHARMMDIIGLIILFVIVLICAGLNVRLPLGDVEWYRFVLIPICIFMIWFGYDLIYGLMMGRFARTKRFVLLLAKQTFFVYCVHGVLLLALEIAKNPNPFGKWGWLIMFAAISILSFLMAFIIKKAFPRIYLVLSGGR